MNIVAIPHEMTTGVLNARWAIQILVTLTIPIFLLAHRLPRRKDSLSRAALALTLLICVTIAPVASGAVTGLGGEESFVVFSVLLAVFVGIIMFVYDTGPWPALFCATAGYTIQNLASGLHILVAILISHRATDQLEEPLATILGAAVPAVIYIASYLLFIRRINKNEMSVIKDRSMLLMFAVVVFVIIGFDIVIKVTVWDGIRYSNLVLLRLVHAALCAFVLFAEYEILYARRMSSEKAETERLLAERERQYRLSRENIEAINIKCHDIRHQIRHFADRGEVVDKSALESIAREVDVYDSVVETGNEALNTILTEKSLACSNEGIVLSCIADGAALDFMTPSDIYSFFGNALDNAIEATRRVDDPERRSITLNVARRGNMVAVSVENYYDEGAAPRFVDGVLQTSKGDAANHGFGTRSMRCIAERNGGTLHLGAKDGIFYLNALLAGPDAR